jgi:hypothetical protein
MTGISADDELVERIGRLKELGGRVWWPLS